MSQPATQCPRLRSPGYRLLWGLQWGCSGRAYRRARVSAADVRNRNLVTDRRARHCFFSSIGPSGSPAVGAVLGMSYGLLFRDEAPTAGWGFLWDSVFGTIWWYLGPMTLLPLLLTGECDWSNDAASQLLPSLLGHLVYGGVTAVAFFAFERRRMRRLL